MNLNLRPFGVTGEGRKETSGVVGDLPTCSHTTADALIPCRR